MIISRPPKKKYDFLKNNNNNNINNNNQPLTPPRPVAPRSFGVAASDPLQ